jgi:hypothetical protein
MHFKPIGAGLDFLGTFFVKKKGSIKQPFSIDHSPKRNYLQYFMVSATAFM